MPAMPQLIFLLNRATEKEQQASRAFAATQQALAKARQQSDMLTRYRQDYQANMDRRAQQGLTAQMLGNHQRFMQNIDLAVHTQTQEIGRCEHLSAQAAARWQEAQREKQAYQALADRAALQKKQAEERRLQKENDEFGARCHALRLHQS